jgi:hypothetical protein
MNRDALTPSQRTRCGTVCNMEQETLLSSQNGSSDFSRDGLLQDVEILSYHDHTILERGIKSKAIRIGWHACLCMISLFVGFCSNKLYRHTILGTHTVSKSDTCASPSFRREWRSLSIAERDDYIDAVFCLRTKPSRLNANQKLYDDFAYVHYQFNDDSK